MNLPSCDSQLPPGLAGRLNPVCDRFEAQWRAGAAPRLEEFLPLVDDADRPALLRELLELEVYYRGRRGEQATAGEYRRRLLGYADLIRAAFASFQRSEQEPLPSSPAAAAAIDPHTTRDYAGSEEMPPSTVEPPINGQRPMAPETSGADGVSALVPGYDLLAELGRGGMGVVYKARQQQLGRTVALKMIRSGPHADAHDLARFQAEAEAVAQLRHPNIVTLYEFGQHEQRPYFTLEFVAGGSLDGQLRQGPLLPRAAAALVEQLARGMDHAHQHDIVHRDLKPANILLDEDGTPRITDFGLVKRVDDDAGLSGSGAVIGTASYMAPEQANVRKDVGPAADTYALGAVLYACLTGRPPFQGPTWLETVLLVAGTEPVPPSRLQPKVPRDLEIICLKCLHKEPARRYSSAAALADDLQRFLNGEPIQARPTPVWERWVKWARRKPTAAGLVVIAVLFALAGLAAILLYARNESQQAYIYKQTLDTAAAAEETRDRSRGFLVSARKQEEAGNWTAAESELQKVAAVLKAQSDPRADELRGQARQRLQVIQQKLHQQEQRQRAQNRLKQFRARYFDTLFYETMFTGLDRADSRAKAHAAATTALSIYSSQGAASTPGQLLDRLERDQPYHNPADRTKLTSDCYELLLMLAEMETAGPAETEAQARQRANQALPLLARAARLGLQSRTYHILHARCLAQSQGEPFDPVAAARTAPPPVGRLDWFLAGLEHYRHDQFVEAVEACAQVLEHESDDYWAHYVTALAQLRLGRWTDARSHLTVCLNLKSNFVWPRLLRGFAASANGVALAQQQPKLAAGEFSAAAKDLDEALQLDPDPLVQYVGLVNRGVLFLRQRQWDKAVADLRRAVAVNPKLYQGYINLAQALQGQGKRAEALDAMNQAVVRAPTLAVVYESRAELHLLQKNWSNARDDFQQAVDPAKGDHPDRLVPNLLKLGKLLYTEEKYQEALACYDRARQLKPEFLATQRFYFQTLLELKRDAEAGAALDVYLAATRPASADVYFARGLLHARQGEVTAAIEMYTLALWQNPKYVDARCQRGWAYLLNEAPVLGLDDFEKCLQAEPTHLDALLGRGNAHIRLKKLDAALADAQAAEKHGPLKDRPTYNLGRIYAQAAEQLAAKARTGQNWVAAKQVEVYKDKAIDCLIRTLATKKTEEQRARFWRQEVQLDPAFQALRSWPAYVQLQGRYGGKR